MIQNNLRNIFDDYNRKLGNHRLSLYQLSKITDIPRTTLNRLMSDPNKSMNGKTLNNLIEFFDIPVNKMIVYKRKPYRFQLMDASKITSQNLQKRVKSHLSYSVALRSVDYHQTIIFTPSVDIKNTGDTIQMANGNVQNLHVYRLNFGIKYANITKYPVFNAIQCSNLLNDLRLPLNHSASFYLMSYITDIAILHSGLISKTDDYNCNHRSGLETNFNGLKATTHNSHYFKLKSRLKSSITINNSFKRPQSSKLGFFESQIDYYRKHFGKSYKNGYILTLPHTKLTDKTTVNFAKD